MSEEAEPKNKGGVQTDESNGDLKYNQSKKESNGNVHHENDDSKHNGDTHQVNGQIDPKPINVAKSGLFSKLMMFLMVGSFFLASSVYVVVEYKDGPVAAVIESAISKEYKEVLIHHINHHLAPLVDSIKGSIREGIQKVAGQDLAGLEDVEMSKESSNDVDKEKVKTETKEQVEESNSRAFHSMNIIDNIQEEIVEVNRKEAIQQDNIKHKEDGKEEARKEPTIEVAEEKVEDKSTTASITEKELKLNVRKDTDGKDYVDIKESGKILEAEKEAVSKVAKDELKIKKAEDKILKEESNSKKTEEEAIRKVLQDGLKFQETEDKPSKTTDNKSKLKDATSNLAREELKMKEAEETKVAEEMKEAEKTKEAEEMKQAEEKHQKELKNLDSGKESNSMEDVKEEVLKASQKDVKNPYPPKQEPKGEASKEETKK